VLKGNHGEMREAVEEWVKIYTDRSPDAVEVDKGHGRLERREVWVVESSELGVYLEEEYGWPGVRWSGRIRRRRRRLSKTDWEQSQELLWIAGGPVDRLSGHQAARWLRGHWKIENSIFWVRDVTYDEDRLHARATGFVLSALRNVAINIIRQLGYAYVPDGRRALSARSDFGLALLHRPLY